MCFSTFFGTMGISLAAVFGTLLYMSCHSRVLAGLRLQRPVGCTSDAMANPRAAGIYKENV